MISNRQIKTITIELIVKSIKSYFLKPKKRDFQILDLLMPKERIIRSKVGGLETSMGTNLWEPLARGLAKTNGFNVRDHLDILEPKDCPENIKSTVDSIIRDRKDNKGDYDYKSSHEAIKNACQYFKSHPVQEWKKPASGQGVDVWIENYKVNYLFDTKTVKPNDTSVKGYIEQLHRWYFFFYAKFPNANLNAAIVFPYNPYQKPLFEKNSFKPLATNHEALDGEKFWEIITNNREAMKIILSAFKEVGEKSLVTKVIDKAMNQ